MSSSLLNGGQEMFAPFAARCRETPHGAVRCLRWGRTAHCGAGVRRPWARPQTRPSRARHGLGPVFEARAGDEDRGLQLTRLDTVLDDGALAF